jgi:hypothetical protein
LAQLVKFKFSFFVPAKFSGFVICHNLPEQIENLLVLFFFRSRYERPQRLPSKIRLICLDFRTVAFRLP